jgi:hypothetical protein
MGEGLDIVARFPVTIALADVAATITPLMLKVVAPLGSGICCLVPVVVLTR